jgi:hypothetical protein
MRSSFPTALSSRSLRPFPRGAWQHRCLRGLRRGGVWNFDSDSTKPGHRSPQGRATSDGNDPEREVDPHLNWLRDGGRSARFAQERLEGSHLAKRHPHDEPEYLAGVHRRTDRVGCRGGPLRMRWSVPRGHLAGISVGNVNALRLRVSFFQRHYLVQS